MKFVSENELKRVEGGDLGRSRTIRLLWAAFPMARSENAIAERASRYLGVTEKTARNWLRGTHPMPLGDAIKLGALVGFESLISILFGSN